MAAKKKAEATKKDFVLGLPRDVPAEEVVAKAKEAGVTLTSSYVYKLRGPAGKRKSKKSAKRSKGATLARVQAPSKATASTNGSSYDAVFARAIVDLGFEPAQALLVRTRERILKAATSST
jgi:hypothetical protein